MRVRRVGILIVLVIVVLCCVSGAAAFIWSHTDQGDDLEHGCGRRDRPAGDQPGGSEPVMDLSSY